MAISNPKIGQNHPTSSKPQSVRASKCFLRVTHGQLWKVKWIIYGLLLKNHDKLNYQSVNYHISPYVSHIFHRHHMLLTPSPRQETWSPSAFVGNGAESHPRKTWSRWTSAGQKMLGVFMAFSMENPPIINGNFWILNWRYLPYIRPM